REVPARFGEEDGAILFLLPEDLPGYGLRARAGVELSLGKQRNEPGLLDGADPQWSIEPEPVDHRTDLAISVPQAVEPHPVLLETDTARQLLINRHVRDLDGLAHRHVLFPILDLLRLAAVGDDLVGVLHGARFESDEAVHNLERRGGDEPLRAALGIDEHEAVRTRVEEHECAHGTMLSEDRIEVLTPLQRLGPG